MASAVEAAGPYRCRTQIWGLHNYGIEAIEEEVAPGEWVPVAAFDGYELPPWESLPQPVRDALVTLSDGESPAWRHRTHRDQEVRNAMSGAPRANGGPHSRGGQGARDSHAAVRHGS